MEKNDERKKKWKYISNAFALILLYVFIFYPDAIFNKINSIETSIEENRVSKLAVLDIDYEPTKYDKGNWQNWNIAVEDEEYIYYTGNSVNIERKNKANDEIEIIIDSQGGVGLSHFMIFDEYLIFRRGKEIVRMKKDGSAEEIIYKGYYPIDMAAYKDKLYFFVYDKGIYTVDVNGRNLECINPQPVEDMTIYEDRIYYSFIADGEGYVKSMDLNGLDKKDIFKARATNMIVSEDGIYYIDSQLDQLFYFDGKEKILISEDEVNQFNISEDGIYGIEIHSGFKVDIEDEYFNLYFISFDENQFHEPVLIDEGRSMNAITILSEEIFYEAAKGLKGEGLVTRKR